MPYPTYGERGLLGDKSYPLPLIRRRHMRRTPELALTATSLLQACTKKTPHTFFRSLSERTAVNCEI